MPSVPARWWRSAGWSTAALWLVLLGYGAWWGWHRRAPAGLSWHFFPFGSDLLFGSAGLRLYAEHPELQIGPVAFVVARAITAVSGGHDRVVAEVLMAAVGPALLAVLATLAPAPRRRRRILLAGLVLMPAWIGLAVQWAHLDDVLALAGCVLALHAARRGRAVTAGVAVAVAIGAKPWAVGMLPVLLLLPRHRIRAALVAAAGTAAAWLPFVAADTATLHALRPPVGVVRSSGLRLLGVRGEVVPAWGRTVQLLLVPAVAAAAALRDRWAGLLLVAVAVRLATDPQDNAYYLGGAVLAALTFDLAGRRWLVPWTALVTSAVFWQPFILDYKHPLQASHGFILWWLRHPTLIGWLHLAWVAAVLALVFAPTRRASGDGDTDRLHAPARPAEAVTPGPPAPVG